MKKHFDVKSFFIGALTVLCLIATISAANNQLSQEEISRLRQLAGYVQSDGNLNMGGKKIIMLGSSIYDDGSQGGGLILRGGANRVQLQGNAIIYDNLEFKRDTVNFNANLDMGNRKIIMLGSRIFDDGSEGGGLQLRGGANKIHFFGQTITH